MKTKKTTSRKMPEEIQPKPSIISKRPLLFVGLVCAFAVIRVFIFSAAFPFFNNVDEQAHFDMVYRYSQFNAPAFLGKYVKQSAEIFNLYGTPEYFNSLEVFPDGVPAPPYKTPGAAEDPAFKQRVAMWTNKVAHEAVQPPAYYILAGSWLRIGRAFGLGWGQALYWIRFLNVIIIAMLVWVSYFGLKRFYPEKEMIWFGVPLLIAFIPQDLYYSINNGVLSPLLFSLAFFALAELSTCDSRKTWFYALTGLACGLTLLVMYTNIIAMLVMMIAAVIVLRREALANTLRRGIGNVAAMLACAAAPALWWFIRNKVLTGAFTQEKAFEDFQTWSVKPFSMMWNHPIFTFDGFSEFAGGLITKFWRGEFYWHATRLAPPAMDSFYTTTTSVLLIAAIIGFVWFSKNTSRKERLADSFGWIVIGASVLMLIVSSLRFDFGTWPHPSNAHPYFEVARQIGGVTIPFLVFYIKGIDLIMDKLGIKVSRIPVLLVLAVGITAPAAYASIPVFSNAYNWFHMF